MTDTMNSVTHELLTKLRVISKIKEGQKLDTANGLNIYTDGWINWLMRKWNRDTKDESVRYLRELYISIGQSIDPIIKTALMSPHTRRKQNAIYILVSAAKEIRASVKGLDALARTYSAFPTTIAALEGIVTDYIIVTYNAIITAIPIHVIPKDFKESVLYSGRVIIKGLRSKEDDELTISREIKQEMISREIKQETINQDVKQETTQHTGRYVAMGVPSELTLGLHPTNGLTTGLHPSPILTPITHINSSPDSNQNTANVDYDSDDSDSPAY